MPEDQNESLNVNAKSIDEAIEQGLEQLGLTKDEVEIEVVSEGKRGLFGLGSEEATVRLTPKTVPQNAIDAPNATPSESESPVAEENAENEGSPSDEIQDIAEESPVTSEQGSNIVEEKGREFLRGLLDRMGIEAKIETRLATDLVEPGEDPPLVFDVVGKDLGILIGRRNETLQALQFMVRLMLNKEMGSWQPIVVDVESYRARRRESLRKLATRMAEKAVTNNQRVVLEAMPAYERRIIHITLRDHPDVETKSIGRDNNRKVSIIPK